MDTLKRRFQIHYGMYPGDKGYVVVDATKGNVFNNKRFVVYTSDNQGFTLKKARDLNENQLPMCHMCNEKQAIKYIPSTNKNFLESGIPICDPCHRRHGLFPRRGEARV